MERLLFMVVFIGWAHQISACAVRQSPSLLVALSGQTSSIDCHITIQATEAIQQIKVWVFFKDNPEIQLNTKKITTASNETKRTVQKTIQPKQSGVYTCQIQCGSTKTQGIGTYIHVRENGYRDPMHPAGRLESGLIALFVLLLLLSASGTYLVLPFHWKKKGKPPKPISVPANPSAAPAAPQPVEETSGSLYTSLQPHSDDVYDVLDDDPPRKTNVEHYVEIHRVPVISPMTRPKSQGKSAAAQEKPQSIPDKPPLLFQGKSSAAQEKPQSIPDKPPLRQKPKKVTADSSVYENLKR